MSSTVFPSTTSGPDVSMSEGIGVQSPTMSKISKLSKHHTAVRRHLMIESVQCVVVGAHQDGAAKSDVQCTLLINTAWLNGQSHASTAAQRRVKEQQELENGGASRGALEGDRFDDKGSDDSLEDTTPAYTITRPLLDIIDLSDRLVTSFDTLLSAKRGGPAALSANPALLNKRGRLWDVRNRKQSGATARHILESIIRRTPSKRDRNDHKNVARGIQQRAAIDEFFQRALDVGGEVVASSRAMQDFFLQEPPSSDEDDVEAAEYLPPMDSKVFMDAEPLALQSPRVPSIAEEPQKLLHDIKAMLSSPNAQKKDDSYPTEVASSGSLADVTFTRQMHVPRLANRRSMLVSTKKSHKPSLMSKLLDTTGETKKAGKAKEVTAEYAPWRAQQAAQSSATSLVMPPLMKEHTYLHDKSSSVNDVHEQLAFEDGLSMPKTSLREHRGGKGSGASSDPGPKTPSATGQQDVTAPWRTFQENNTALDWLSVDSSRCTSIITVESDALEQVDSECSSDQIQIWNPAENKQTLCPPPQPAILRRVSSMPNVSQRDRTPAPAREGMDFQQSVLSGEILMVKEGEENVTATLFEVVHSTDRRRHRRSRLPASSAPLHDRQASSHPSRWAGSSRASSVYVDGSSSSALRIVDESAVPDSQDSCIDPITEHRVSADGSFDKV